MTKDLTVGKTSTVLWKFCLPLFGSIIFQQLYNIADSLVAGKWIGENALAAVGNSYELTLIFIAIAFGCNMGCSVIVSQFFGAKRNDLVKSTIATSFISAAIIVFTLMVLGTLFSNPLLELIHTPSELIKDSALYLRIYIYGLPFVFFYNISNGIFTALGDSKTPFIFLAVSSVANIFVDILFVVQFHMGIAGVAWATFLCQSISAILAVYVVLQRIKTIESEKYDLFNMNILRKIMSVGIPSMLQQSFISIGNIMIQGIINGFGAGVMAGYSASVKLNNLVITSFTTIGNGISNYTAQNLGANKIDRIHEGFKAGIILMWSLCIPFSILYFFGGSTIIQFFINDPTPLAIYSAKMFLRILAPFYFIVSAKLVTDGILRGSQMMKHFMYGTFADLILRVVLAYFLSTTSLASTGIWCGWPIGWSVAAIMSYFYYKKDIKKDM